MAFDHPLEADKVDDMGLFSTFVRAPVFGVIMWALGGDEAKKREEEDRQRRELKEQLEGENEALSEEKAIPSAQFQQMIEHNRKKKMSKQMGTKMPKMPPKLIGSDLSNFGDLAMEAESKYADTDDECDYNEGSLRRNKKMSWSDESGQDLCEVFIDKTSVLHEPQHRPMASASSTVSQPKKSVIKRTRSVLKEAGSLNKLGNDPTMRFLPKGINPGHGGIIYPTNPNAQSAGYISPEGWGWYITTTPPTPDMYHHSSKQAKKIGAQHSAAAKRPSALTNPAFKAGAHKTAMGWPSVPL